MRNVVKNTFDGGLVSDLHPSTTTPKTIVEAKNVQFTTRTDNQVILQKMDGVEEVVGGYSDALHPLGAQEYNNVIYMVSYNENTQKTEVGTYPSVDYDKPTGKVVPQEITIEESANVWYDSLPQNITISEHGSAYQYTIRNILNVSIVLQVDAPSNTRLEGAYIRTIAPGSTTTVILSPRTVGTAALTLSVTGIPELEISEHVFDRQVIGCTVVPQPGDLRPIQDYVHINYDSINKNVAIYNDALRVVTVSTQAEPGLLYTPLEDYDVQAMVYDKTITILPGHTVTKHLNIIITDAYGSSFTKTLEIDPV